VVIEVPVGSQEKIGGIGMDVAIGEMGDQQDAHDGAREKTGQAPGEDLAEEGESGVDGRMGPVHRGDATNGFSNREAGYTLAAWREFLTFFERIAKTISGEWDCG